ncbi:MAG TPA: CHASE3 domain-containing protein [Candidatus Binatia bacterium]|jgi:CHASE3 domain sensor protein|nr:CHASE3 domain-containing protein [Candidatus Binatia bacterium]
MRWLSLGKKTLWGFSLTLLLQLVLSVVAYRNTLALMAANRWVAHTQEVLATLESLLTQARDAEVERGYLLTGDELFLAPYQAARQAVLPTLQQLRQLTTDDPQFQVRLSTLDSLIKQRLILAQSMIDVRQSKGPEVAIRVVQSGRGSALLAEIHALVDDLRSAEVAALQQRRMTADRNGQIALSGIVLSDVLVLAFVAFASGVVYQDRSKRKAAEWALLRTHQRMEQQQEGHAAALSPDSGEPQSKIPERRREEPAPPGREA